MLNFFFFCLICVELWLKVVEIIWLKTVKRETFLLHEVEMKVIFILKIVFAKSWQLTLKGCPRFARWHGSQKYKSSGFAHSLSLPLGMRLKTNPLPDEWIPSWTSLDHEKPISHLFLCELAFFGFLVRLLRKCLSSQWTLLLSVLTLAFVFVSRAFAAGDDEDLKSENENKHEVSCLQSSPLSIKAFRNRLRAMKNTRLDRIRKKICIKRPIWVRVDKLGANRVWKLEKCLH